MLSAGGHPGLTSGLPRVGEGHLTTGRERKALPRRALGQNALQAAAMHLQPAGRFGDVAVAHFVDALDMFPAHASGRHRMKLVIIGCHIGGLGRVVHRFDRRKFIEKINNLAQAPANLLRLRQRNHALIADPTQVISQLAELGSFILT
jgi:hypothetical protein